MRVLVGNLQAAGVGINLTAATHVVFNDLDWVPGNHWQAEDRIHRIGQTSATFATYCYAPGTLDGYVAALLEEKARNIGVLEAEAATAASLLEAVVNGARSGDGRAREPGVGTDPARLSPAPTLGVLADTLDLWAEARRASALSDPYATDRVITITSRSTPGVTYEVRVTGGIVTCTCPGFSYRGNCTHARDVAAAGLDSPTRHGLLGARTRPLPGALQLRPKTTVQTVPVAGRKAQPVVPRRDWRPPNSTHDPTSRPRDLLLSPRPMVVIARPSFRPTAHSWQLQDDLKTNAVNERADRWPPSTCSGPPGG